MVIAKLVSAGRLIFRTKEMFLLIPFVLPISLNYSFNCAGSFLDSLDLGSASNGPRKG